MASSSGWKGYIPSAGGSGVGSEGVGRDFLEDTDFDLEWLRGAELTRADSSSGVRW